MMMYPSIDVPYYDDDMEADADGYYEDEESYLTATRAYRWVRPGYGKILKCKKTTETVTIFSASW